LEKKIIQRKSCSEKEHCDYTLYAVLSYFTLPLQPDFIFLQAYLSFDAEI